MTLRPLGERDHGAGDRPQNRSEIVRRLELRAAQHGRSAEAEHRGILERVLGIGADYFWVKAARLRERTRSRKLTNSADLFREDRDRQAALIECRRRVRGRGRSA